MRDYNGLKWIWTLSLAALVAGCAAAPAPNADAPRPPGPSPQSKPLAIQPAPSYQRTDLQTRDLAGALRDSAPLRYVVKPGDTLWDIAGHYLRKPWYWPQLWDENPDIANPHQIYPGEVLTLSRNINGQPSLHGERVERLSPKVRAQPIATAIPTIPLGAIRDFLVGPRLVSAETLDNAPYIVSFEEQHLIGGTGATVYIRGASATGPQRYAIVRPGGPYKDSRTGRVLGQQALPVGEATITQFGPVATGRIDHSDREVLPGDRLLPIETHALVRNFHPRAPTRPVSAHIISVYGGVTAIGQYDVVTLDRGTDAGLKRGDVLDVYEAGRSVADPITGSPVLLPEVRAGRLIIFKTERRVSFGLIMRATRSMHVNDVARSPEA